jgi:hypothetical protein
MPCLAVFIKRIWLVGLRARKENSLAIQQFAIPGVFANGIPALLDTST